MTVRSNGSGTPPDEDELWLVTYSDLVTLLFAVFVMLLALATVKDLTPDAPLPPEQPLVTVPEPVEADDRVRSLTPATPVPPAPPGEPLREPAPDGPRLREDEVAASAPEPLADRWRRRLEQAGMPAGVAVTVQHNRVGIVIGDAILFAPGQADLSPSGRDLLARLAPVLAATPGEVVVEGHTDAIPIATPRFPSNWELSAARAAAVVRLLEGLGLPPHRLSAVGYADTRPLVPETDAESRARNRRVTLSLRAEGP
ncbi:OmpA/MotB family protein [Azospirillum halopraeferens]|uniref:OmpA/MotB family protein n=1 Tax=Azospirillum halopraeferens TaxID=34010 RepID=UPI000425DF80|nr:OmpA family protein [Azospirillum halopraeferens]